MKRFCADLRYATKVTDCKENEMMPLTKKQEKKCKKTKMLSYLRRGVK